MPRGERRNSEIAETIRAEETWEKVGPTPMPELSDLRNWDRRLLETYKPLYAPVSDVCSWCTFGKCDLSDGKRGACGLGIAAQQARVVLQTCITGLSAHGAHGAHLVEHLIERFGEDFPVDLGEGVAVEAPVIRNVLGLQPKTLGDLKKAVHYVMEELIHLVSSTHTGQEGSSLDFESKSLHAGMLDFVAMEASDIAQTVAFRYPSSEIETPFVELGWGALDREKAVILVVGHNAATANAVTDYLEAQGLSDKVDVGGLCCTALDATRYSRAAKIVGPLSRQRYFVRSGIADVVLTDEQCVLCDNPQAAQDAGSAFIAASDKAAYGLPDLTGEDADRIVQAILEEKKQVLVLDPSKAAEVAVRVALARAPQRHKKVVAAEDVVALAKECKECRLCDRACANLLPVGAAVHAASEGRTEALSELLGRCIGCGRCEQECPKGIPILQLMQAFMGRETYRIRAGRGAIGEVEIREASVPIAFGTNPGIVAIVGCSNYPEEMEEVADIVDELARRKYIVMLSGCAAMAAAMKKDREGRTVYEKYPPTFFSGGVINVGSCVANSHIVGAAIKVANIFAKIPLRANFEVIADYILNRIGACGLAWGAYSQKAASIATGCNRWGIPVVLGPHGAKYGRFFLSDKEGTDWRVMDGRKREVVDADDPCPEHLLTVIESKERALIEIAKLCIRRNDTHPGRQVKLHNYIDLSKKYLGAMPDDLERYVRKPADIPLVYKKEVTQYLKEKGWQPKPFISSPTIIGTYPSKATLDGVMGLG